MVEITQADIVERLRDRHITTSELAKSLGVPPATLRKWNKRGDIPAAPHGLSGQGRGNECLWSPLAQQQARKRRDEQRVAGRRSNLKEPTQ